MAGRNWQKIWMIGVLLCFFCVPTLIEQANAGRIFSCKDESGTLIFQNTPCVEHESKEIILVDLNYQISTYPSESNYYQPSPRVTSNRKTFLPGSTKQDKQAIAAIKRKARTSCGSKYYGDSESRLQRSAKIASKQKSISGRNDRAEISCHLKTLARIERIKSVGFEVAMRDESRTRTSNANYSSSPPSPSAVRNNEPNWLIDPFSGRVMPRTGAGYTDPTNGTFYQSVAGGVVNTRTGQFTPTTN